MNEQLFHDAEITVCSCDHLALDHHGVDSNPRNGGCFGNGSGHPWSPTSKCPCTQTCTEVLRDMVPQGSDPS